MEPLAPKSILQDPRNWKLYPREVLSYVWGIKLHDTAEEIILSVLENQCTAVKGCHESGKTYIGAAIMHWWLCSSVDSIIVTTAPSEDAVERLIWRDYHDIFNNGPTGIYPTYPLKTEHSISDKWYAVGRTARAENAAYFQGFHTRGRVLYIIDEGSGVDPIFFDARHRFASKPHDRVLMLCNPYPANTEAHRCFKSKDWHCITVSAFDTPNVKAGEVVIPGMVQKEQVDKWRNDFGEDSVFWKTRVLAEFYEDGDAGLIPLSWWDAAVAKWKRMKAENAIPDENTAQGIDVSTEGQDETIAFRCNLNFVQEADVIDNPDTTAIARRAERYAVQGYETAVDAIGVGTGVVSTMRNDAQEKGLDYRVTAYKGSEGTAMKDKSGELGFANLRSYAYWLLRESMNPNAPDSLALPDDPKLKEDIVGLKYREVAGGKIQVEEKQAVVKRLGRSPDRGDALVIMNFQRLRGSGGFVARTEEINKQTSARLSQNRDALDAVYGG